MTPSVLMQTASASLNSRGSNFASPHRFTVHSWGWLVLVLLFSATYAGFYLKRGWVPHDEGAFAMSAERILHGELPHRDFVEIYTGGLAFLNAGAMRVFGVSLPSIRYPLFIAFL